VLDRLDISRRYLANFARTQPYKYPALRSVKNINFIKLSFSPISFTSAGLFLKFLYIFCSRPASALKWVLNDRPSSNVSCSLFASFTLLVHCVKPSYVTWLVWLPLLPHLGRFRYWPLPIIPVDLPPLCACCSREGWSSACSQHESTGKGSSYIQCFRWANISLEAVNFRGSPISSYYRPLWSRLSLLQEVSWTCRSVGSTYLPSGGGVFLSKSLMECVEEDHPLHSRLFSSLSF